LAQQEPSDKLIRTAAALERNESTCPYRDSSLGASAYNINYPSVTSLLSFVNPSNHVQAEGKEREK
jgi:hypothetical protein